MNVKRLILAAAAVAGLRGALALRRRRRVAAECAMCARDAWGARP